MALIDNGQLKKFKEALEAIIVSSQGLTYDECKGVADREASFLLNILLSEPNIQSSNIKETIRAEIERMKKENKCPSIHSDLEFSVWSAKDDLLNDILYFLNTLPESAKRGYKDCNGCEYNRTVKDQIGWQFRGCFGGEYKGKPIAEIELCPLKVDTIPEQPVEYPTSTEMIAEWENNELPLLRDKDFRGDAERMAYNAFMDGFAKGLGYKK